MREAVVDGSDTSDSRQWAVKNVGGGLMIAAAVLVIVITVLYDVRGEPSRISPATSITP